MNDIEKILALLLDIAIDRERSMEKICAEFVESCREETQALYRAIEELKKERSDDDN